MEVIKDSPVNCQGKDNNSTDNKQISKGICTGNLDQVEKLKKLADELASTVRGKKSDFPIEVFPEAIKEIILETNECSNYPIDFTSAGILAAASIAIGNKRKLQVRSGWTVKPVLYIAVLAEKGMMKSPPIKFALNPLKQCDSQKFAEYEAKQNEYEEYQRLNKSEREAQGIEDLPKPYWEQFLVSDFTPESLIDVHKNNKNGLGVYADELASWINNFNRYNKGSEEQFWLSTWDSSSITINRKTSGSTHITHPFISVIGTIQPAVLVELSKNRMDNGFLDRILFAIPKDTKRKVWSTNELNNQIIANWETIISNIVNLQTDLNPESEIHTKVMEYEPTAKKLLIQWQADQTAESNKDNFEHIRGLYSKLEIYISRLALILQILHDACGQITDNKYVNIEAVDGAIKLINYFKKTAIEVYDKVTDTDPLNKLPLNKKNFYGKLSDNFETNQAVEVGKECGSSEATVKRWLRDKTLFKWLSHGKYEKVL